MGRLLLEGVIGYFSDNVCQYSYVLFGSHDEAGSQQMVAPAVVVSLFVDDQNKSELFNNFTFLNQFFQVFLAVCMEDQQVSAFEW